MRKKNFSSKDRKDMENKGQMNIFDMLNAGVDPDAVVAKAEAEIEDAKIKDLKATAKKMPDNPIGMKTDGTNMDIEDMIKEPSDELDEALESALSEALEEDASFQMETPELETDKESLAKILNEGMAKEEPAFNIDEKAEYEFYTLDDFAGSEPDYEDRLIAFNTSLDKDDPQFVVAAPKSDYSSIVEFKAEFAGQGGLNEHCLIAFPLKAESEPEKVIGMYEKKIAQSNKVDTKNADKEAKRIAALEASGEVSEDMDSSDEPEQPKKRGRKAKLK